MTQNKNENILKIIKSREFKFGKKRETLIDLIPEWPPAR